MGNTCMPVADSFQYMAEPIQYSKVKKKKKNLKGLFVLYITYPYVLAGTAHQSHSDIRQVRSCSPRYVRPGHQRERSVCVCVCACVCV